MEEAKEAAGGDYTRLGTACCMDAQELSSCLL